MPITIDRQKLVDAIIDRKTVMRNSANKIYLPYYVKSAGVVLVASGSSYVDVADLDDDANYTVLVEVGWNTAVYITNKTSGGFKINFGTAPTSDSYVRWVKVRSS